MSFIALAVQQGHTNKALAANNDVGVLGSTKAIIPSTRTNNDQPISNAFSLCPDTEGQFKLCVGSSDGLLAATYIPSSAAWRNATRNSLSLTIPENS